MASQFYNSGKVKLASANIAYLTDTIKVALLTSSYTPDKDAQHFLSDVNANESSGTGYTAGGTALTSKTVTEDDANDRAVFDAADASWTTSTIGNARWALIYKDTGSAATSPLICVIDLLTTRSSAADTFKIEWDAAGIFYLA